MALIELDDDLYEIDNDAILVDEIIEGSDFKGVVVEFIRDRLPDKNFKVCRFLLGNFKNDLKHLDVKDMYDKYDVPYEPIDVEKYIENIREIEASIDVDTINSLMEHDFSTDKKSSNKMVDVKQLIEEEIVEEKKSKKKTAKKSKKI